jgi:hypothetical protein
MATPTSPHLLTINSTTYNLLHVLQWHISGADAMVRFIGIDTPVRLDKAMFEAQMQLSINA